MSTATSIIEASKNSFDKGGYFVGEDSADIVTNILIHLYSTPVTPIREIFTNALEVNDFSRGKVRIDIETVSANVGGANILSNGGRSGVTSGVVTISDFGPGMSKDFVENFLLGLGLSTKRDSEGGIGGKGIGAKSASYVSKNAIWHTTKDGVTTNLVVSREDDMTIGGTSKKITSSYTGEADGTKVIMPVDAETLHQILRGVNGSFIDFMNPDEVEFFVDSQEREVGKYFAETSENGDVMLGRNSTEKNFTILTLGNMPYEYPAHRTVLDMVEKDYRGFRMNDFCQSYVVNVNHIGREHIAPSRESVIVSNKLNQEIANAISANFRKKVDEFFEKFESVENGSEWFKLIVENDDRDSIIRDIYRTVMSFSYGNDGYDNNFFRILKTSMTLANSFDLESKVAVFFDDNQKANKAFDYRGTHSDSARVLGTHLSSKKLGAFISEHNPFEFFNVGAVGYNTTYFDISSIMLPKKFEHIKQVSSSAEFMEKFFGLEIVSQKDIRDKATDVGAEIVKNNPKKYPPATRKPRKDAGVRTTNAYGYFHNGEIDGFANNVNNLVNYIAKHNISKVYYLSSSYINVNTVSNLGEHVEAFFTKNPDYMVISDDCSTSTYKFTRRSRLENALESKGYNGVEVLSSSDIKRDILTLEFKAKVADSEFLTDMCNNSRYGINAMTSVNPAFAIADELKYNNKSVLDYFMDKKVSSNQDKKEWVEFLSMVAESKKNENFDFKMANLDDGEFYLFDVVDTFLSLTNIKLLEENEHELFCSMIKVAYPDTHFYSGSFSSSRYNSEKLSKEKAEKFLASFFNTLDVLSA